MTDARTATRDRQVLTDSGIEIEPVYRSQDEPIDLPDPGDTRGIYPTMYRGRRWTMRQYAGYASAEESNRRYRLLLRRGQTGLSVAFDLPSQINLGHVRCRQASAKMTTAWRAGQGRQCLTCLSGSRQR